MKRYLAAGGWWRFASGVSTGSPSGWRRAFWVYGLLPRSGDGCNPYVVTRNPSGGSRAIAVVEAFDAPNAASNLAAFSTQFGLPAPTPANFQVVYASGGVCTTGGTKPGYDLGWEAEATLDVQWAHAMAPRLP
jgi:kumamolisin